MSVAERLPLVGSRKQANYLAWVVFGLVLLVIPFSFTRFWVRTFALANVFAVWVLAWNVLSGQTSYISFGHSFLIGVAAYTTAILSVEMGVSPYLSAGLGIGMATLAGVLTFLPTLRLQGVYFTFVSLLLPIIGERLAIAQSELTGGERGIIGIPPFLDGQLLNYYITAGAVLVIGFVTWRLIQSDFGTILAMVRQSEDLVQTSGINPEKYKFIAFAISAFIAGIGGVLQVHFLGIVTIGSVLALPQSINIVIAAVIGGRGSTAGAIAGAYFYVLFNAFFRPFTETPIRLLAFFVIGMLVLGLFSDGIIPSVSRVVGERLQSSTEDGAAVQSPE